MMQHFIVTTQWIAGAALVFALLARFFACNPGIRWWKMNLVTDIFYWYIIPLITPMVTTYLLVCVAILISVLGSGEAHYDDFMKTGFGGPVSTLPLWLQCVIYMAIADIYLYWIHRLLHRPALWRYHVIHHAPVELDWLHAMRFHPLNTWLSFVVADVLCMLIGVSPIAILAMGTANRAYSLMVHANLNWTFGPLRYVLASPVFHRWHHTAELEGRDKNFAPTFPILDVIFGTFYMPKGRVPTQYGVDDPVPDDFFGQLLHPFRSPPKSPSVQPQADDGVKL